MLSSLRTRPFQQFVRTAVTSSKSGDAGVSRATSKQIAAQRERHAAQQALKRKELKRMSKLRDEALHHALDTPLYLPTLTALRYLRAAEVGHPLNSTTLTMFVRVVADRGTQPLFGSVKLPKSLDSGSKKVAVFTTNEAAHEAAVAAGADFVGGEDLIEQVKAGQVEFHKCFATPEVLSKMTQAGLPRMLGPKGLMPSAKRGTVGTDIASLIESSAGKLDFRQKQGSSILALPVGKIGFSDKEIVSNLNAAIGAIRESANKVVSKKPVILGQTTISSTHGPGIVIEV